MTTITSFIFIAVSFTLLGAICTGVVLKNLWREKNNSAYAKNDGQEKQFQISQFFKNEINLRKTIDQVLKYIVDSGGFKTSEIWLVSKDGETINLYATYSVDEKAREYFEQSKEIKKLSIGQSMPGTIWKTNKSEIWDDIDVNELFVRKVAAKAAGLKSVMGLPLIHNNKTVGVLMMTGSDQLSGNRSRVEPYITLGNYLGAEIKRKQQEEEMYLLFQGAPEILAVASPTGHFTKVNPAFTNLLGYTEEEIISTPFENFIHQDDKQNTLEEYSDTITGDRQAKGFVNRYKTKSGDLKWISWSSSDVFGDDGSVFAYGRDITEVKELQQLLENASKMALVGSWELSLAGKENGEMYWSPMTREIFGVDKKYNPGTTRGLEFYDEESKARYKYAEAELINTGKDFDIEILILTQKGEAKWVRCIGKSERDGYECSKIYGSFQDIHTQKANELKLKTSLKTVEDYKFALDQSAIVELTDAKGIIASVNDNFCHISKYEREELIGKTHQLINSGYHPQEFFKELWNTISSGKVWRGEIKNKAKDDSFYWVDTTIVPLLDDARKPIQYLAIRFDVTARKIADKKVLAALEERNIIFESIGDAFFAVDHKFIVTYWNNVAESLLGIPKEKVLGTNYWELFPDLNALPSYNYYHRVMDEKVTVQFEEYYEPLKKWFETSAYPSTTGMSVYFKDITERKKTEIRLFELNRDLLRHSKELSISNAELEQFAYVASHDLQEPLRMVTSFLTQLEKRYKDQLDEKAHKYIHFAVDGARRMRKIILDLLDFSRVGRTEDKIEVVDMKAVIQEIELLLRKQIEEKEAVIEIGSLPVLKTMKSPVYQIFLNLIENALKYQEKGNRPVIKISCHQKNDGWEFKISDNGIGIEPEYFEKIFIIFQRLHNKTEYTGTGMGLAITKKIVENLGGKIWLESKPGNGTSFYFTIPAEETTLGIADTFMAGDSVS